MATSIKFDRAGRRAIIACDVTVPTRLRSQIDQAGSKKAGGSAGASAGCKWGREPGSTSFPLRAPPADTSPIFTPKALPWSPPCPAAGRGGCCAGGHLLKTVGSKSPLISVHLARACTAQWGRKHLPQLLASQLAPVGTATHQQLSLSGFCRHRISSSKSSLIKDDLILCLSADDEALLSTPALGRRVRGQWPLSSEPH